MIHALLDDPNSKNIVGFEVGTRVAFDTLHSGDPLWVFLDYDIITYRVPMRAFLLNPKKFYIDKSGAVQQHVPVIIY